MESGTATTPEWIASELLVQFLDDLRDAGYNIGIQQYIAVQDLVLTLMAQGELSDLRQLTSFIGPIVCSSATEQIDFQGRFEEWTKQFKLEDYRPPETQEQIAEGLVEDLERIQKGGKTLIQFLTGVVVIAWVVLFFPSHKLQEAFVSNSSKRSPSPEPTSTVPLPNPTSTPDLGPTSSPNPGPTGTPDSGPTSAPEPSPLPSEAPDPFSLKAPDPPASMVEGQQFQGRVLLFIGVVSAVLLVWRYWWYRIARQFLNRRESNQSPELQKISMQGIESSLFPSTLIFQTAQKLRRRTQQLASTLDIQQTLLASIKQGGWFTPIYGTKKVIPEYLFLIDRASYADHQAKLTEELIQQLQQNGVYIKRYFFDGDAQICYPERQTQYPQSLQDLCNQYSRDRLVIVAEAATLFSHQTGEPESWLEHIQAWNKRVILTPNPVETWNQWEFKLIQQFILLPLTPQGIAVFSQIFLQGSTIYRLAESPESPFPEMLGIRSRRWLERYPPRAEEGQQMLAELSKYLGESGLYWFAACAVFPELHWTITVYLGNVLKNSERRALLSGSTLSKLVRLPWFRYGYIPDWLRRYLVLNLTPDQNRAVRQAFRQLMVSAVRGGAGPLQLEIAQQYQQTLPNLTRPLLRLLSRQISDEAPLRDYIFLDFMAKESLLTVAVPDDLKPLFHGSQYEKALHRQKLGLTVVVGFILALVGVNIWWVVSAPARQMNQLLQETQTLAAENNHLEALVKLTRLGQLLRASTSPDSSIHSSTTRLLQEHVPNSLRAVSSSSSDFHQRNQLQGHKDEVLSVAFSPDSNTIASASRDSTIKLWDRSGKLLNTLEGHKDEVLSVAFSPDGNTIASASGDSTIKLWPRSIDMFVAHSCNWLKDYMQTNPDVTKEDKELCGIPPN